MPPAGLVSGVLEGPLQSSRLQPGLRFSVKKGTLNLLQSIIQTLVKMKSEAAFNPHLEDVKGTLETVKGIVASRQPPTPGRPSPLFHPSLSWLPRDEAVSPLSFSTADASQEGAPDGT